MFSKWITAILTLTVLSGVAFAQDRVAWDRCTGRAGPIPDVVIKGCSQIIEDTQNVPKILATAHNNRGVAHRLKGEYDLASDDYNEAIRLNPNSANFVVCTRHCVFEKRKHWSSKRRYKRCEGN
jgi:hypothetical protein